MTFTDVILMVSGSAAGLLAGLMLTLVSILQRMWLRLTVIEYIKAIQVFLAAAKGHPVITVIMLLPMIAPILILLDMRTAVVSIGFRLTLAGLVLAWATFLTTLRFNFPIYATIMGWQADSPPPDWTRVRQRFFWLNVVRMSLSVAAMLCFLLALAV